MFNQLPEALLQHWFLPSCVPSGCSIGKQARDEGSSHQKKQANYKVLSMPQPSIPLRLAWLAWFYPSRLQVCQVLLFALSSMFLFVGLRLCYCALAPNLCYLSVALGPLHAPSLRKRCRFRQIELYRSDARPCSVPLGGLANAQGLAKTISASHRNLFLK